MYYMYYICITWLRKPKETFKNKKQDARVHELMYRCQGLAQNVMEVFRMPFEWHLTAIEYHSNAIDQHRMSFGTFDDVECHAMYEDIPIPFNDM